ncbi:uncharacterized protein F5147DRAFT_771278 [Suillus discolor]|uniref:Uncharacterized protein n=1 Tax=Suillus discolor TaxID=1912936 RepID=A0A9P7FAL1_9AGAM|nr:uncharacterized protein F5147DRAFT_771278 [Suillus discolor]KAG2112214.1 hypothetical protein F5147DRAFT_771278 [Suillus discolor]
MECPAIVVSLHHPKTRPGNANKHPRNIVWEANRVQHQSKEEVAAEKAQKQAEKDAHAVVINESHMTIAAAEDAMAIQQKIATNGLPKLIRPCIIPSKKSAPPAVHASQSTTAPQDNQTG